MRFQKLRSRFGHWILLLIRLFVQILRIKFQSKTGDWMPSDLGDVCTFYGRKCNFRQTTPLPPLCSPLDWFSGWDFLVQCSISNKRVLKYPINVLTLFPFLPLVFVFTDIFHNSIDLLHTSHRLTVIHLQITLIATETKNIALWKMEGTVICDIYF